MPDAELDAFVADFVGRVLSFDRQELHTAKSIINPEVRAISVEHGHRAIEEPRACSIADRTNFESRDTRFPIGNLMQNTALGCSSSAGPFACPSFRGRQKERGAVEFSRHGGRSRTGP